MPVAGPGASLHNAPHDVLDDCNMRPAGPAADWAVLAPTLVEGASLLRAHFVRHQFERHSHETWSIGVTFAGRQTFRCRGTDSSAECASVNARTGWSFVLNGADWRRGALAAFLTSFPSWDSRSW